MESETKASKEPNYHLRESREMRGWSQRRLAEELGTSEDSVSKWERGINIPDPHFREKLCNLFEKNAEELGLIKKRDASGFISEKGTHNASSNGHLVTTDEPINGYLEMNKSRRTFLQQSIGVTSAAFITTSQELINPAPWEKLSMVLAKPSDVDTNILTHLEMITKSYWQLCTTISSHDILSGVLGHLQTLTRLLQYPYSEATRAHLCSLAGEVAQIAGKMSFDMNDYFAAQSYYKVSMEAAKEANNNALYAVALGRTSFLPVYSGRPHEALGLLQQAHKLASKYANTTTRSWLAAVEAEARANIGDINALDSLLYVEQVADQAASDDPYWTGFNRSRLAGYKGVCHIRLKQPKEAFLALNEALSLLDASSSRRRSTILVDLATAQIQQGELEEACKLAGLAIEITNRTKSSMVLQRIHDFRKQLSPWEDEPVVENLDEQLVLLQ